MELSKRIISSFFKDTDITINDPSFFKDVLLKGSLGLGDSYIEGKWDSDKIDELVFKLLPKKIYQKLAPIYDVAGIIGNIFFNFQTRNGSKKVIEKHYNMSAKFYAAFLDPYFQYTCGFFENTNELNKAQEKKMDLICKKLELKKGQRVLDIGGGWGGLARFMKEKYGVKPTVLTLSKEQADYILKTTKGIEVWLNDYRDLPQKLNEPFDAVSAIGIFEHIGHKNYSTFMRIVNQSLKKGGKFLLHTLFTPYSTPASDPWLHKHIFPNGEMPPLKFIENSVQGNLTPYKNTHPHFQELTPHYHPTLVAWDRNLEESIKKGIIKIPEREQRKWHFYFMACAGAIKAKRMRVAQFLYKK